VRSEAAVVIFLQKASAAKRVYATVVNARTNTDGNKEQGITFPSGNMQKKLIKEVYSEAGINPADVAYVEAHGTGTKVNLTLIILVSVLQLIVGVTGTTQTTNQARDQCTNMFWNMLFVSCYQTEVGEIRSLRRLQLLLTRPD
jgi:hypothetical protein